MPTEHCADEAETFNMRVYIAGPYTKGDVAVNVRRALEVANRLLDRGHSPYIPHLTHFWHLVFPRPYEDWIYLDLQWIEHCEAVVRLAGESLGADGKVRRAEELGIPVWYDVDAFLAA